jgi:alpha-N-arabinofuranosidase
MGNIVYGGLFNPEHPSADDIGLRKDVMELIKSIGFPAARLPGGNIMSGWEWKDSIGPKSERKAHLDLAWRQYEPMDVGHDEYCQWAIRSGMQPIYTVNMGTGSIQDAIHCVEYTNHPSGTYWSDLRRKNGFEQPHAIKTWCIGNEMDGPWQIHSWQKDPAGYAYKANEASKAMKWVDPTIETVVCGSSSPFLHSYPDWDRTVLETCYEVVDYLSIHHYHSAPTGDVNSYMASSAIFDQFIERTLSACDYVQAKLRDPRKMMIALDEYGVNFSRGGGKTYTGRAGRIPNEVNCQILPTQEIRQTSYNKSVSGGPGAWGHTSNILNALGSMSVLMSLLRHADRVKIGCMTGAFMSVIRYDMEHAWKGDAFYPFTHMLRYGQGVSLRPVVSAPTYTMGGYKLSEFEQYDTIENIPFIDAACALNEEKGEMTVFIINHNPDEGMDVELDARGFEGYKFAEHIELKNFSVGNTFENQEAVKPGINTKTKADGNGKVTIDTSALSWNVLRFVKA